MSLHIEELSKKELMGRYGFDRYKCRITGTIDGIDLEKAYPWSNNEYDVELWHEKQHNGMCRVPAFDQTGYIPHTTYNHLCQEVKSYFKNKEIKQSLTPKTQETFNDLINEL